MKWPSTFIGLGFLVFNALFLLPAQADCVAPPAGLVSWWPGEGNANDIIGTNNGTLGGGATYASGLVGQGFRLDGVNSYVEIPDADALKPANLTVEAWVWLDPNVTNVGGEYVIFKRNSWTYLFEGYTLVKDRIDNGDGTFTDRFDFIVTRDGNQVIVRSVTVAQRGVWYHVAGTYDGNTAIVWVNGVPEASLVAGFALDYGTRPVFIGTSGEPAPYQGFLAGIIDEPSIYNRVLSSNEIASIYNAGSAGKCAPVPPVVPEIFNIAPVSATNGASVILSGTNFSPAVSSNIVYFGAVQAAVQSASLTNLVATVPVGATFAPVTVTVNGLTACSGQSFEPTFPGAGAGINNATFGPRLNLPSGNGPNKVVIADLDGDGKPDLIVANDYNSTISLYRNISTNGTLTAGSFAPRVDLATPAGQYSPFGLVVADVDGDGKLDIIVSDYNSSLVSVYRNTCTPGNISSNLFATRVDFATGSLPQGIEVRDIDGDGRPDILTANTGDGSVSILRNTGTAGSLTANSFAPRVDITTGGGCDCVAVGDLDGDGKPDVVTANYNSGTLTLLHNLSSPGNIAFDPKADIAVMGGLVQVTIGDLDGDGKPDLAVAAYLPQTLSVLRNVSSTGSLTTNSFATHVDFALGGRGHSPIIADLDGDGKPDLAVATELDSLISIFQNTSTPGSFTNSSLAGRVDLSTGWNAWGVAAGDLDGDGRPDVVFCNSYDNTISIYQNQSPVIGPPVITSQPTNQAAVEGSGVAISVTAAGAAPLAYQWSFNGASMSGATNAAFTLTNLHPNQAGNYQVRVANSYGAVTSSVATLTVIGQSLLVYNYAGNEQMITAGKELTYAYSGEMFFNPASTNGTFVGWATINGHRQYWVSPFSDYLLISIPGGAHRTFTVLGKAGQEVDGNNNPHIWSYLHRGQNTLLSVGNLQKYSFPDLFSCNDTHIYPDAKTGNMVLLEATSTYTFSAAITQAANNKGQTMLDLVNALVKSLARQGYQKQ